MEEFSGVPALEQELKRLRAKLSASEDRDIRQALQLSIDGVAAKLEQAKLAEQAKIQAQATAEQTVDTGAPATPDQIRKADELIRQARVEKMRKNGSRAATLLKEAAQMAPTSPAVLETLGDELIEQRKYKDACETYGRALRFAKNNVELEKKHALAVLRSKGLSSLDAGMRSEMSDSVFLNSQDTLASNSGALWLNAFVPGVGHLAVGKTAGGIALIASVVVWAIWLALMHKDLTSLVGMVKDHSHQPNLLVLVPLFGMVVTYIIGFTSLGSQPQLKQHRMVARPEPPVNLPFE